MQRFPNSKVPKPGESKRSRHWPTARRAHLQKQPLCAGCGGDTHLQVHHCKPFHLHPALELKETNLITLCEKPSRDCHYRLGHEFDWKAFNPHVRRDADLSLRRVRGRRYS
jgi:5-methylcytosine-specific restriction endonuclease McrA